MKVKIAFKIVYMIATNKAFRNMVVSIAETLFSGNPIYLQGSPIENIREETRTLLESDIKLIDSVIWNIKSGEEGSKEALMQLNEYLNELKTTYNKVLTLKDLDVS